MLCIDVDSIFYDFQLAITPVHVLRHTQESGRQRAVTDIFILHKCSALKGDVERQSRAYKDAELGVDVSDDKSKYGNLPSDVFA